MAKVALVTGITGQDGAYLAEFLLLQVEHINCLCIIVSIDSTPPTS